MTSVMATGAQASKSNGRQRPLGVAALEGKVVQRRTSLDHRMVYLGFDLGLTYT